MYFRESFPIHFLKTDSILSLSLSPFFVLKCIEEIYIRSFKWRSLENIRKSLLYLCEENEKVQQDENQFRACSSTVIFLKQDGCGWWSLEYGLETTKMESYMLRILQVKFISSVT